jgi:hypothetical protein
MFLVFEFWEQTLKGYSRPPAESIVSLSEDVQEGGEPSSFDTPKQYLIYLRFPWREPRV